ncbi:MAG: AMP-binding protein, partial [Cyanobacteria bacterium P01_F01_bin.150]
IGFFVNSLVMHTDLSGNPSFNDVLTRVRQTALDAYAHQDIPFEKLVEVLQPERSLSHNPLFQVMFALQQQEILTPKFSLPNLEVSWYQGDQANPTTRLDIEVHLYPNGNEIKGICTYNRDLFEPATIRRLFRHYRVLLQSIVSDPKTPISQLALLTPTERKQLLKKWSQTATNYPAEQCLHQLFEAQAEKSPDAIALIFEDQKLTYHDLNCKANQLAHYLQRLGVEPEVLVGVCIERSLDAIIALLAVLKAGGAYVPLDPNYPSERLQYMLDDSQSHILLTQKKILDTERLPSTETTQVICLDHHWPLIYKGYSCENPLSMVQPDNLAYVIYTSGSTGNPKGVQGLHRGTVNRLYWMWHTYPFEQHERGCQKTALSFVDSVWEIFGGLLQGIVTVIIPDSYVKDPYALVQTLSTNKVTRIVVVPSLLRAILQASLDTKQMLRSVKYWVSSGEKLDLDLCHEFYKLLPHSILINLYGSSEVSADATYYETHNFDVSFSFNSVLLESNAQQNQDVSKIDGTPQTPEQEIILSIWKMLLGRNTIKIQDNFFEIGGNQTLAIQVITYLRYIFGLHLPNNLLQSSTSIETLSKSILNYENEPGKTSAIAHFLKKMHGDAQAVKNSPQ